MVKHPINNLPNEVLYIILQHVYSSFNELKNINKRRVCSKWRDLIDQFNPYLKITRQIFPNLVRYPVTFFGVDNWKNFLFSSDVLLVTKNDILQLKLSTKDHDKIMKMYSTKKDLIVVEGNVFYNWDLYVTKRGKFPQDITPINIYGKTIKECIIREGITQS